MCSPIPGSGDFRNERASIPLCHHQIGFFVVPAITEPEVKRRWIALCEELLEFGLVMLFEQLNRTEVIAEKAQVQLAWIEVSKRNSRVVLHNSVAVRETEIVDSCEILIENYIGRRFDKNR